MLHWLPLTLSVIALLLTAGFRRHRLLQFSLVLCFLSVSLLLAEPARGRDAALAFAPLLIGLAAVLPEARWRARRSAIWLSLLSLAVVLSSYAPLHVVRGLNAFLTGFWPGPRPHLGAMTLMLLCAGLSLYRWILRGQFFELAATVALLGFAALFAVWPRSGDLPVAAAACALLLLMLVLIGSYRMAFVDGLTGLPNRRALDETLDRLSGDYAIAMVDVDHFKQFNDTHGHAAGDIVLREVGAVLRKQSGGKAFRYGGEEFCLLYVDRHVQSALAGCDAARAALEARAIRVRTPTAQGKAGKPKDVRVTASLGLAQRDNKRKLARDVLQAADKALYKAKAQGRNRVVSA